MDIPSVLESDLKILAESAQPVDRISQMYDKLLHYAQLFDRPEYHRSLMATPPQQWRNSGPVFIPRGGLLSRENLIVQFLISRPQHLILSKRPWRLRSMLATMTMQTSSSNSAAWSSTC